MGSLSTDVKVKIADLGNACWIVSKFLIGNIFIAKVEQLEDSYRRDFCWHRVPQNGALLFNIPVTPQTRF